VANAPVDPKCEKGTPVALNDCLAGYFGEQLLEGVRCDSCAKPTNFTSRLRFITYPKTLVVVLQRFVHDDYVPKKLEVELQMPHGENYDEPIDFETFRSLTNGEVGPDEVGLPAVAQ